MDKAKNLKLKLDKVTGFRAKAGMGTGTDVAIESAGITILGKDIISKTYFGHLAIT